MSRLSTLSCALALTLALAPASAAAQAGLRPEVMQAAERLQGKVVEWRRDIHQHPELGNRETRTAALVAGHLRALGLEPETGIATTGVTALLKGGRPGPRIALRADMDALPVTEATGLPFASKATATFNGETVGVMHACGHDAHTSILMGVAEALVAMRDELPGEVLFVFQPAEEGPPDGEKGGAEEMLAQGIFKEFRPDAVFGLHVFSTLNAGKLGVRSGPTMAASDRFNIVVQGRQTHGSRPWGGVDPIVAAADIIGTAQTVVSRRQDISSLPVVLSFGAIRGGVRFNIIPDRVELVGTIRTFDEDMRQAVFADLANVADKVAAAHGATVVVNGQLGTVEQFREIVDAFIAGDFELGAGVEGVPPVSADRAAQIRDYVDGYGATLVALPDETWSSSVCIWYGDHWAALVDLWTEQEGRSDLVLHTRVKELDSGFSIEVDLVYVP